MLHAHIWPTNCSGKASMPTRAWLIHTFTKKVTRVYLAGVALSLISAGTPCSNCPSKLTCFPTEGWLIKPHGTAWLPGMLLRVCCRITVGAPALLR
jgi:hypothetical protein